MIYVDSNELQKLYIAYFGRPGDPSGINYWISRSKDSLTIREISNELSRQDEYINYFSHDRSFDFKINAINKACNLGNFHGGWEKAKSSFINYGIIFC